MLDSVCNTIFRERFPTNIPLVMKNIIIPVVASLALVSSSKAAEATTSLESLLPAETVLVMATPDYATAKKHFKASASGQFWDSAEFKPFRKKLADGFEANVLDKIEA